MRDMKLKINSIVLFSVFLLSFKAALFPSIYFKVPSVLEILIELLAYSIIVYSIMKKKKNIKELLIFVVVGLICLITAITSKSMVLFSSFLLFYVSVDNDEKKIIRIIYRTVFVVLSIHFFLFILDYAKGNASAMQDVYGRTRYSIGFNHPNRAGFLALWCYLGYCYADSKKMYSKVIAFIPLFIIYKYTDCRSIFLVSILYLILCCFSKNKKNKDFISKIPLILFIIVFCITIFAVWDYWFNGKFGTLLDKISNQRIYYSYRALRIYGPTLLGREINTRISIYGINEFDWLVLDNLYTYCIYGFGIVHLLFLTFIAYGISKLNNIEKSKIFICWIVYAFFELSNMNFIISFAPILGASYLGWCGKK